MAKLFHFDCETTGLEAKNNSIFQISGIIEIDGEVKEEFDIKCKPMEGKLIDPGALKVNKMTEAELMTYPQQEDAYKKLINIISKYVDRFDKSDKFFLVGYNVHFDVAFMREFFLRNNDKYFGSFFWSNPIDVMVLATLGTLNERKSMKNFKLITVAEQFGVELGEDAHEAMADTRATREIFHLLMDD